MRLKTTKLIATFYVILIMGLSFSEVYSQEVMNITKNDNTVLTIPTSEIQSITFSNSSSSENSSTVTDIDGNVYKTVKIDNQVWMAENLRTTKLNNGQPIPLVTENKGWIYRTTLGYCWYDNDEAANNNIYGALYNWYTIENVCPIGWHVPSNSDWDILIKYVGITAGNKLKEVGTEHWQSPNSGATNISGFTAVGSGYRNAASGIFDFKGGTSLWWTSSEKNATNALTKSMSTNSREVGGGMYSKSYGACIRCLKD